MNPLRCLSFITGCSIMKTTVKWKMYSFFGDLGIAACLYRILIQNQKILHYFRMSPYIMNNEHILKGA